LREIARIIAQACRAVQQGNAKKSGAATAPDVQNARKRINVATNLKPTLVNQGLTGITALC
jgi:hypothetical protein